jgi:hypothetical protein
VDSTTSCHMKSDRDLFDTFIETGSTLCVKLGMGAKHEIQGFGTVPFGLETGEVLRVSNVLWVL